MNVKQNNGFRDFSNDQSNGNIKTNIATRLLQFNFCPQPLNKNNIIKINVEIIENLALKEAFKKALQIFNKSNDSTKIIEKTEKYKIKLSKKSGMPDMDLPGISENIKLNETNSLNFSIIIDSEHLMIMPKKKYDPSNDALKTTSTTASLAGMMFTEGNSCSSSSKSKSMSFDIKSDNETAQKKSKGCCDFLKNMFTKPKNNNNGENLLK